MPESKLVSRAELLSFMNVGTAVSPSYALIGEGFTSMSESKNPKEYSRQYVHERTERTDIIGYAPSIAYSADTYTNNAVIAKIRNVTDHELIGSDAQVDIVTVSTFEGSASARPAYKRTYAIIPDAKGDGVEALIYSGNFKAVGDIVEGTFNENLKTFTAGDGNSAYRAVTPSSGDNPAALGWYESDGQTPPTYTLTEDTTVDSEATYYARF